MSSVKVKFGEAEFTVPKLTLGQVEDLVCFAEEHPDTPEATTRERLARGRAMAGILFKFAEPAMGDLNALQATHSELRAAADQVMRANGLAKPADETGKAPEPAPAG